jgi:transmembrane sensor
MTAGDNGTDLNAIDLEALRWVMSMESGPLAPEEQRRFDAWIAESSRHKGALIRAQAASLRLDRLGAFAGGRSVLGSLPSSHAKRRWPIPRWPIPRWLVTAAVAASVAGIVGLGAWLSRERMQEASGGIQYVSNRGELKEVKLADGSAMTLNTQTQVRVQYTRERRDIHLIQGEALFTVAHDPRRPFTVEAGKWTAVAVGTAFSVHRLDAATTDITVTEGVVEMRRADRSGTDGWPRLTRNQEAILDDDSTVKVLQASDSDIGKQLAWRNHLVVFTGESLSQALVEMNRYSPRRIVVEDPELAGRQIVGVFSTLDTPAFVSGMEATLGVQAVANDQTIVLRQKH